MSDPEIEENAETSPSAAPISTEESQPAATEETSATNDAASDSTDVKEEETSLSKVEPEETTDNGDNIDEEDTSASMSFSFEENSNASKVPTESENSVASQEIDSNGIAQSDEPKSTTENMECDPADKDIELKTEIDAIVEEEKESLENDSVASKENTDKSNVLDDDLIFVKPKEKDRGHCYW